MLRPLWKSTSLLIGLLFFAFSGNAQVTASFSSTPVSGCSPLVTQFTDLSTGPVTTWFWDFGNGNTSTLQNPAAVYVTPGTYTVSLTVGDGTNTDTQTQTNLITVFENPVSNFTSGPANGCAPFEVCFSDISTPGDGTINQWLWDFGDGQNSTAQNPCHTFANAGAYTITLVVTDDNGCSNTFLINNYVNVSNTPVADFSGSPLSACDPPLNVSFTNNSSGGQAPLGYQWDFGDGNTSTAQDPTNNYVNSGTFNVTLIATDQNGCADTLTRPSYININNIGADFTADSTTVCEGEAVNFTDLSTGSPNTWDWDFGDGNTSNQQNPSHAYAASGTYTVTLIAGNGVCADTIVQTNFITVDPGPTTDFVADTTNSCESPFTVNFTDLSTGVPVSWQWDFGDGNTSTAQNPTHTYTADGSYDVTLITTSPNGCTDTLTFPNYIQIVPPIADFVGVPLQGCIPLLVDFTDQSISNEPIVSWQWDFGDGNTSNAQNPQNTYTIPGVFDVTLIIVNAAGCTDTLVRPAYIEAGEVPVACFTNNPSIVCVGDPVDFFDCSTNATDWFWEFGDGGTSTQQNPTYAYGDTGCYTVTLTVMNFGCDDDTVITNAVCVNPPVARFDLNPQVGCAVPHAVVFTDQSILPDTWFWDFGDGNTSTLQNPVHNYTAPGNYTVTLTVADTINGCSDDATAPVNISIVTADFSGLPLFGCGPLTVDFTDASTSIAGITNWAWDFGDGGTSTQQNPTYTYQTPGIYTVTLTVTDGNGCTDTQTRTSYVQVIGPDVNFGADTLAGCVPLTVNFTDSTIFGAPITSWTWDFGDGNTSNQQNPSHQYTTAGNFDVSLTVTDIDGCSRTLTFNNYILVTDPVAAFTIQDSLTCEGVVVGFLNNSSGVGLSYVWDFGDGTPTSTATNPGHSYGANGNYTITLAVTDVNGCQDTLVDSSAVEIADPLANFGAAPVNASCPPLLVVFSDSSEYDIVSWDWDFGDGTGSVLQNPSHVYATAGSFDVSLAVVNDDGCTDTLLVPGLVNIDGPNGNFTFAPDSGCTPLVVDFNATSTNTASYTWDFGDGNVVVTTVDSVMHTYTQTGVFNPILILDDGNGCTFSVISPDSIIVDTIPFPDFTVDTTLVCDLDSVRFFDATVSTRPIVSWFWDFGDGNTDSVQNPVHFYNTPGSYTVSLTVINSLGCINTITNPAAVGIYNPPTAVINPIDSVGCSPFTLPFADSSFGPQPVVAWDWDLGNGNTSVLQNPIGTYTTGNYVVTLIAIDSVGCRDTVTTNAIATPGPTGDFVADDSVGCLPFLVTFTATAGQGIVDYDWDFGDGNTTSGPANVVAHTYITTGNFTVTLVVTDTLGCQDTIVKPQYIQINPPIADFNANVTDGCPALTVTFTDASTATNPIQDWQWDFGNGDTGTGNPVTYTYTQPGTFTVTLIVTDTAGCMDTVIRSNYIEVFTPPTAAINPADTAGCAPFLVPFADASTGPVAITGWAWDFDNGNTATTQTSSQNYPIPGNFVVSLIVTDANGCRDTVTSTVFSSPGPSADFVADDSVGCPPHPVTFTATADVGTVDYAWDFGDGNVTNGPGNVVNHLYTGTGNFTVTLIVTDTLGCMDTIVKPQYIQINPPIADFNANVTDGCPALTVTFTDASTATNPIQDWQWDFGNGDTGTGNPVTYTYTQPGTFTVTLIVTDTAGCMDTVIRSNYIEVFTPPTAAINPADTAGCAPFLVPFADASTGPVAITGWAWDFDNGNTATTQTSNQNYPIPGNYVVELIVTDANGCRDTVTSTVFSSPGPSADFVADDSVGCPPHPVTFTATADVGTVDYAWDFGDGNVTNGPGNVVNHLYTGTGNFTVTLIVTDTLGCMDTIVKPQYIQINPPIADFNANVTDGCPALTVTFTDASTATNPIQDWQWDFGNGDTGTGNPVTYTYTQPGTFTVTLIVIDTAGCMDTVIRSNYIEVFTPPTAAINPTDTAGCAPFLVPFADASTGPVAITGWAWDFDNGNTATTQTSNQNYPIPGNYVVELIVSDANGCRDTVTSTVFSSPGPSADFVADDSVGCPPHPVTFTATADVGTVDYAWDFGDGNVTNGPGNVVNHLYTGTGNFTVTLIVTDTLGCMDTIVKPQYIQINPPIADFNANVTDGCPALTVTFTDASTATNPIQDWQWDFGNGDTGTGNPVTYTYTQPGTFTVTLIVTDTAGCMDTVIRTNYIEVFTPPTAAINPTDTAGCAPFLVPFADASTGPVAITGWAWDFDNGNTATTQTSNQTYPTPGNYVVELIVTDANGCRDTVTSTVFSSPGPTADFVADDSVGCPPHPVVFTATAGIGIVDYDWDFGDGTTTNGPGNVANHTYQSAGNWTVTLIVTDTLGCQDTIVKPQYIQLNPPLADFNSNVTDGCPALTVTFNDISTGTNTIVAWDWDFGNGDTGTGNPVTYTYTQPGLYDVTLIVTDDQGCMDTIVKPAYIEVFQPPMALFGITDTLACSPFTIQLTDSSTAVTTLTNWDWDFGDGNTSTVQNPSNGYVTPGNYLISLIVTDANGCTDTSTLPFTAPVRPEANFTALDSVGCEPFDVTFIADSIDVVSWTWDFGDGNDTIGGPIVDHLYLDRGVYDVQLIIEDIYGCFDTLVKPEYIFVDSVGADFSYSSISVCAPITFDFVDLSTSDTTINDWQWDFGDGGTSTAQNPSHVYAGPGMYTVTLIVTNVIGCTDTVVQGPIEIFDNLPPAVPPIYMTTVTSNTSDSTSWMSYQEPDFSHYVLYWEVPTGSNNWVALDSFFNVNDTFYVQNGLNNLQVSYCYKLQVVDICGFRSDLDDSDKHCTIELEATPGFDENFLNWSAYIGWDSVLQYDIYRVSDYSTGAANFLATVPGNVLSYTDTSVVCYQRYCYRVQAQELGGFNQVSWSDTSCATPIHLPNQIPMEICAASVEADSFVTIGWDPPGIPNAETFFLEKSNDGVNWISIAVLPPSQFSFDDFDVQVDDQSYYYRISVLDSCGDRSPWSDPARTILLETEVQNTAPSLFWNAYEQWAQGVADYEIEVKNDATGLWQNVSTVSDETLFFTDRATNLDQIFYCYRIIGNEAGGSCRSMSNESCVPVGPQLFAPNAFTPNGDGTNEFFELKGIYIRDYNLLIFDRWGALIYESESLNDHWDGTWRGKPCQEGVYVWVAKAVGFDDTEIELRGTATLIR